MYERSGGSNELIISTMPTAVFEPTAAHSEGLRLTIMRQEAS